MLFGEKLKKLRVSAGMSQQQLADKLGITRRSIVYYETKSRYPKTKSIISGLADVFDVSYEYLLNDSDEFVIEAEKKHGTQGRKDAMELIGEIGGLFAGGALPDEDKDKVFKAISDLYWESKNINKKYSSNKS